MFQGKKSNGAGLTEFFAGRRIILMDLNGFVRRNGKREKSFMLKPPFKIR